MLSGSTCEIDRACEAFAAVGIKCARLPVAAAFHSRFVADASGPFRVVLESVKFAPTAVPVFSNTTAAVYPDDPATARDLLANQLARPVAFVECIGAMVERGVRTFVEVGAGAVLTKLTEAILADGSVAGCEVFALDATGGKRSGVLDLACVLTRLLARGHRLDLTAWEAGSRCRPEPLPQGKPGLTIPLTGANHVSPRNPRPPVSRNGKHERAVETRNGHVEFDRAPGDHRPTSVTRIQPIARAAAMPEADSNALAQALLVTQQSLAALQRMQEQTAALHKQFLESQESAQRTLHALVEQQQSLLLTSLGPGLSIQALPTTALSPQSNVPAHSIHPPPAAVLSPSASPPPPAHGSSNHGRVAALLLAVVSEKTGYPADSLDLSLSLDADLGVDSIKRVEILSALQERLPDAPVVKPEHLGTLHTLRDVANFLAGPGTDAIASAPKARTEGVEKRTAVATTGDADPVIGILLDVIAEKTGYPISSLDPTMSLDADLGVDSIKRVEILAAVREKLPGAPEVKAEHLGTLHTIRDVADFLLANSPLSAPATTKIPIFQITPPTENGTEVGMIPNTALTPVVVFSNSSELSAPDTEHVSEIQHQTLAAGIERKGGRGSDVSRPPGQRAGGDNTVRAAGPLAPDRVDRSILQASDLDLSHPRPRVSLPRGGEIWVVAERDSLVEALIDLLAGHGFKPKRVEWEGAKSTNLPGPLVGLVLVAPRVLTAEFQVNRHAFAWLKLAAPKLRQAGRNGAAILATISRMDGAFGMANLSADTNPTQGGLAGLVKTACHEWPEVSCKAIDLDPNFDTASIAAAAVVDEILSVGPARSRHRAIASVHARPCPHRSPGRAPADQPRLEGCDSRDRRRSRRDRGGGGRPCRDLSDRR